MNKNQFFKLIAPAAQSLMRTSGVLASVTMAQAALESGYGDHMPGNNMFGVKWVRGCGYESQELTTHEQDAKTGDISEVKALFRKYRSPGDSLVDHNKVLMLPRYARVRLAKTYVDQCKMLKACGYATDLKYPALLISIIEKNKLYVYDVI